MPGYNSVFLEQVLLLGRKTVQISGQLSDVMNIARETYVIICTTMYREVCEQLMICTPHIMVRAASLVLMREFIRS
jgi:hypothetical protein